MGSPGRKAARTTDSQAKAANGASTGAPVSRLARVDRVYVSATLERDLRTMAPGGAFRLDAAGWFTG